MSKNEKLNEEQVFKQEISDKELENVSGGSIFDFCDNNSFHERDIYSGDGFPNCANTVEDGSFCDTNDACYSFAVTYTNMVDCSKSWH